MFMHWHTSLFGQLFRHAIMQASTVVHARSRKKFNQCVSAVKRAAGRDGGSAASNIFQPLELCPFNGTAVICQLDTSDHTDDDNTPGMCGAMQPLGCYPEGEGVMTLVELGVVLLYQPVDTLLADFHAISHYTLPLVGGFRYALAHFFHKNIYDYRATTETKKASDEVRKRSQETELMPEKKVKRN